MCKVLQRITIFLIEMMRASSFYFSELSGDNLSIKLPFYYLPSGGGLTFEDVRLRLIFAGGI